MASPTMGHIRAGIKTNEIVYTDTLGNPDDRGIAWEDIVALIAAVDHDMSFRAFGDLKEHEYMEKIGASAEKHLAYIITPDGDFAPERRVEDAPLMKGGGRKLSLSDGETVYMRQPLGRDSQSLAYSQGERVNDFEKLIRVWLRILQLDGVAEAPETWLMRRPAQDFFLFQAAQNSFRPDSRWRRQTESEGRTADAGGSDA